MWLGGYGSILPTVLILNLVISISLDSLRSTWMVRFSTNANMNQAVTSWLENAWHSFFLSLGYNLWCHNWTDAPVSMMTTLTSNIYYLLPMSHVWIEVRTKFLVRECLLPYFWNFSVFVDIWCEYKVMNAIQLPWRCIDSAKGK